MAKDDKRVHRRAGIIVKVKCRICFLEQNEQSYPDHLKLKHPGEETDLSTASQRSVGSFFTNRNQRQNADRSRSPLRQQQQNTSELVSQGQVHPSPSLLIPTNSPVSSPPNSPVRLNSPERVEDRLSVEAPSQSTAHVSTSDFEEINLVNDSNSSSSNNNNNNNNGNDGDNNNGRQERLDLLM